MTLRVGLSGEPSRRAPFGRPELRHRTSIRAAVTAIELLVFSAFLSCWCCAEVWIIRGIAVLDRFVDWEMWNDTVRGHRDPTGLFAVEIICVCTVFDVGNK
ncbi:hypothetical protein PIB30_066938, partial [Stylosanthes scabra]|nr:hypothetical protein [Stylosanthes scabra]